MFTVGCSVTCCTSSSKKEKAIITVYFVIYNERNFKSKLIVFSETCVLPIQHRIELWQQKKIEFFFIKFKILLSETVFAIVCTKKISMYVRTAFKDTAFVVCTTKFRSHNWDNSDEITLFIQAWTWNFDLRLWIVSCCLFQKKKIKYIYKLVNLFEISDVDICARDSVF